MASASLKRKSKSLKRGNEIKSLDLVMSEIRSVYGVNSIHRASEARFLDVVRQRSGIHAIDFATGGGYPYGRYTHIYGPEGVSKTYTAMKAVATVQQEHPKALAVWVDLERVFDKKRAKQVGIDLRRLIVINEESIERNLSIAEKFIEVEEVKLFVFDSVAAIITIAELDNEVEEQTMGVGARLLNKFLRRWTAKTAPKKNAAPPSFVILLNQTREKINKGFSGHIPPKPQPTGGRGLRFFTSLALELAKGDRIEISTKDDDSDNTIIGHEVKVLTVKNNTFPPNRVGKFLLVTRPLDVGGYKLPANAVDNARDLIRYGRFYGVLAESGAWISYGGAKWNGRLAAQTAIAADPSLQEEVYTEIMNAINEKLGVYKDASEEEQEAGAGGLRALARKKATGKRGK
jgi:protein RecA